MEGLEVSEKKFWRQRNVLVTGVTGLLGPWLAKDLAKKGANVISIVRDIVPCSNFYSLGLDKSVTAVQGCLENYEVVERTFNEYEINTCFHLGAQTIVGTANRSPLSTFNANIKGTWNVLEAARNSRLVERVVVASSDKAYGTCEKLPYDEGACLRGEHPYDVSKSCADLIAQSYFKTYGLPVGITRCGNFYGGGDLNFNRIIPGTIRSIIHGENPVIRSDGKLVREYFYILDAVFAYTTLAENLHRSNVKGEAFNFGNETPVRVIDLVGRMLKLFKRQDLKPVILNQASNEIREQYLSCKKARKVLGWKHKYSLEEGLEVTYQWYADYFKGRV